MRCHENLYVRYHSPRRHAGRIRLLLRGGQARSSRRSWTSWASTTSRAAGPAPIPRTRSSSPRGARAQAAARPAHRLRLHALRQEPGGRRPQRARAGRGRHAGGLHLRQDLGPARARARWASPKTRTSSSSPKPCSISRTTARKWSTTPSISSTAISPTRTTPCARSKPRRRAGADVLCLCDTNGGTLTGRLAEIVAEVRKRFDGVIGIHTHNDSDLAVANTIAAVEAGATHVQGCMNGYGERCGNANLASVIANLELKLGHTTIGPEKLASLASVCRFIAELANLPLRNDQPFVGKSAFAHKGGVHVSAVLKDSATYEHIQPEAGRQPPARAGERSFRPRQHPLQAQAARPGRPPGRRRAPRAAGAHQADGVRRLRAGSRRRHLRAAGARSAASRAAFLRRGQLRSGHARRRRRALAHHRHRHAAGAGRRAFRHRHRPRPVQRAAPVPAQVPVASSIRRSPTCG